MKLKAEMEIALQVAILFGLFLFFEHLAKLPKWQDPPPQLLLEVSAPWALEHVEVLI